ncbi:MAG: MFS transporter [Lachnospiraceae bacterium]
MKKSQRTYQMKIFDHKIFDSRIRSANTERSEKVMGYFVGPMLMYMMYVTLGGSYLTQFYTDVLGIGGVFLTMMPLFSKIFDAFTNVVMGRIIDKTRTKQGKARPWLLISGVAITVTGILLYSVPNAGYWVQIVWIVISYNLFFAFAFTVYNMSHTLMVPLSTRNTRQRDELALLNTMGTSMIPGALAAVIMPYVIAKIGVGSGARSNWMSVMSIVSILAIPAVLVEYYFTKERLTEESIDETGKNSMEVVSWLDQAKACCKDKYWVKVMVIWGLFQIMTYLSQNVTIYFCNWVLGSSVTQGATIQMLINVIGKIPMGPGMLLLWPIVKRFGKRRVFLVGFLIAAVGDVIVLFGAANLSIVLVGMFINSIGCIPTFIMAAILAEAMDHVEYESGFRVDGFTVSVNTILVTVSAGLSQTIILGGINRLGYIQPTSSDSVISQPMPIKLFFIICFAAVPLVTFLVGALLIRDYPLEAMAPMMAKTIQGRYQAAAEARGEKWISPEEKAAREQAEMDRIAEENRIKELKEKCEKHGLNFEEEEAKYQDKLARSQAKKEAKQAEKEAKVKAREAKRTQGKK